MTEDKGLGGQESLGTVYLKNGLRKPIEDCDLSNEKFYVEISPQKGANTFIYPGDSINYDLDHELVSLYNTFRDLLFPDRERYDLEHYLTPIFVQVAGQDPDCSLSKDRFLQFLTIKEINPNNALPGYNIYKHLYLVDCQFLIGTVQNLLSAIEQIVPAYYVRLSEIDLPDLVKNDRTGVWTSSSPAIDMLSAFVESYFIKAYSILDAMTKIAFELITPQTDFSKYKKLKSDGKLWGARKDLPIKAPEGTIFEKCDLITIIESIRNEAIHNTSWSLRPKVFLKIENAEIVERFMLFPDIENGRLSKAINRCHFFSQYIKVNDILPSLHYEFCNRLLTTIQYFNAIDLTSSLKAHQTR